MASNCDAGQDPVWATDPGKNVLVIVMWRPS